MKTLRVMVCGLLMFSILGCPVLAAAAPMAGEMDPAAVEAMDPNVIAPDGAVVEDAAPAVPEGADQETALPPAGDQIVDAEPGDMVQIDAAMPEAMPALDAVAGDTIAATNSGNVMVNVPWKLINQCGHQTVSGPCQAYCWAYCRIILDNKAHKYTDYWTGTMAKAPSAAGYGNYTYASTEQAYYKVLYDNINKGRPVVVFVRGSRISGTNSYNDHFVVVIGYKSSCNTSNFKQSDFLILDPASYKITSSNGSKATYTSLDSRVLVKNKYGYFATNGKGGGTNVNEEPTFRVTLNPNGGKVSKTTINVTNGKTYSGLPTPTRSGYTFDGWYTATTGGDKVTSNKKVDLKKNQTLYAHWKKKGETKKTYTVTFNPNGGTVSQKTKKVEANGVIGSMPTPTRKGYTFHGWSTSQSGAGMLLTTGDEMLVNKNTTLYAQWKKVTTEIKFSGLTAPKTLKQGSIYSLGGTITSKNSNIASVKAEVINNSTKKAAISSSDSGLNTSKYSLPKSKVDNNLKFGTLKAGTYYIKYTVKAKDNTTKTSQTATFTVKK